VAQALITFDQLTHATTPKGSAGRARKDLELGEPVVARNTNNTDVTRWRWQLRDRPVGSTATISDPTSAQIVFTPDIAGSYRLTLSVNDGLPHEIDTKIAAVLDLNGFRFPASGEQATEVNWLVSGSTNEDGWAKDVERILRAGFAADLLPSITDTYDLGSSVKRWRDLWLSRAAYLAGGIAGHDASADDLSIGDGTATARGMTFYSTLGAAIYFADTVAGTQGGITYLHSSDTLSFRTAANPRVHVVATAIYPETDNAIDVGTTTKRWAVGRFGTSVIVPLLVGGDFGVGSGAGTAQQVRGGHGGTTGGAGGAGSLIGGSAQANNDPGGKALVQSGDSHGTAVAPNIEMTSGAGSSPGTVRLTNTCLEIAEAAAIPGPTISPGFGRYGVLADSPSRPAFEDDTGVTTRIALVGRFTGFQNFTWLSTENVVNGLGSVSLAAGGLAFPTAIGEITASDWVDFTGTNAGSAPTINGYVFFAIAGESATIGIRVVSIDLDTSASTVGDDWLLMLRTTTAGDIIFARIALI
jgi:hypothetical protein